MNNAEIIRTLEAFRKYTNDPFGKYAAGLALKKLRGGYVVELTKEERYSLREHLKRNRKFPTPKRLWPITLSSYDNHCPHCQKRIWGNARIVRVLKETPDLDLVSVLCQCGTLFRKYELKRDEL